MVERDLAQVRAYWHILTMVIAIIFTSALWVSEVRSYGPRIGVLEHRMDGIEEIRFNLKNVAERLGVTYIEWGKE